MYLQDISLLWHSRGCTAITLLTSFFLFCSVHCLFIHSLSLTCSITVSVYTSFLFWSFVCPVAVVISITSFVTLSKLGLLNPLPLLHVLPTGSRPSQQTQAHTTLLSFVGTLIILFPTLVTSFPPPLFISSTALCPHPILIKVLCLGHLGFNSALLHDNWIRGILLILSHSPIFLDQPLAVLALWTSM